MSEETKTVSTQSKCKYQNIMTFLSLFAVGKGFLG